MKRFNKLNEKINEMPEIIQDFMRKLSKKLEITLNHTKNRKIPSTNNLAELLFRVTFPGALSNILWVVVLDCDFFVKDIAFVPSYSHVS